MGIADRKMSASQLSQIQDFTTEQYAKLLRIATLNYKFIGYREPVADERFILWRHDCDYSLNRSLRLAQLEHQESVKSTYFLNPHCEFYNLLEKRQAQLIEQILALGHNIGLHFDAAYYNIGSEDQLEELVEREAGWLENWFSVEPAAFSFHNPTEFLLSCERDTYGGLINCYSRTFKTTIPYCSDSNGYWRFRRLRDVLESAQDPCLQVLTHPGWWQEVPQHPRERIFRSVYGRAVANMNLYDDGLEADGRENLAGPAGNLRFLKDIDVAHYQLCDYLWNNRVLQSLFIELYRLHEHQINQLCKAMFYKVWRVPACEVSAFFEDDTLAIDRWRLFQAVFGKSWEEASGCSEEKHKDWVKVCSQLIHGCAHILPDKIEEGCVYLCNILDGVAKWGRVQEAIGYDGITHLSNLDEKMQEIGSKIDLTHSTYWKEFKSRLQEIEKG